MSWHNVNQLLPPGVQHVDLEVERYNCMVRRHLVLARSWKRRNLVEPLTDRIMPHIIRLMSDTSRKY